MTSILNIIIIEFSKRNGQQRLKKYLKT